MAERVKMHAFRHLYTRVCMHSAQVNPQMHQRLGDLRLNVGQYDLCFWQSDRLGRLQQHLCNQCIHHRYTGKIQDDEVDALPGHSCQQRLNQQMGTPAGNCADQRHQHDSAGQRDQRRGEFAPGSLLNRNHLLLPGCAFRFDLLLSGQVAGELCDGKRKTML